MFSNTLFSGIPLTKSRTPDQKEPLPIAPGIISGAYDPSLPSGILYRTDWMLTGPYAVTAAKNTKPLVCPLLKSARDRVAAEPAQLVRCRESR